MSEINLSAYDVTQIDYIADLDDGNIPQSGTWIPLISGFKRANFKIEENRIEHRGNLQTLSIDQRVKKWGSFDLELLNLKYHANLDWWDIVKKAFYGTGAEPASPALRPATIAIGAKLNRPTPEYWTMLACKLNEVTLGGSFVDGHTTLGLKGLSRKPAFNTTNYVQGTAVRGSDPTKTPLIPASDISIYLDGVDRSTEIQDFTLTLTRTYEQHGRDANDGMLFREFIPSDFDGRLDVKQDPLRSTHLTNFVNDTAITCEIRAQNTTNGKKIQFTAAKIKPAEQEHAEGQNPSTLSLAIVGSTFSVSTLP